jgi:hypothetical protein
LIDVLMDLLETRSRDLFPHDSHIGSTRARTLIERFRQPIGGEADPAAGGCEVELSTNRLVSVAQRGGHVAANY